jgi:hypothetical protein
MFVVDCLLLQVQKRMARQVRKQCVELGVTAPTGRVTPFGTLEPLVSLSTKNQTTNSASLCASQPKIKSGVDENVLFSFP